MAEIKKIAVYLRVSKETSDIDGQRKIIGEYIKEHNEFDDFEMKEYCDNGYSGKNFNRPDVQRLLNDCKNGDIDCIIVKDISRFGRNYIECGEFIEKIFPLMGIRFIAVNDMYDSFDNDNEILGIKNIANDFYRRDISEKIKKSIEIKKKTGEYFKCYYGYKKINGEIVKDIDKVKIIELIFQNASDGIRASKTAKLLNEMGVLSPGGKAGGWCVENIWKILRDERYSEEIVDREIFNAVQEKYKKRMYREKRNKKKIGIVCGECGYCIRKKRCGRYNVSINGNCSYIFFDDEDLMLFQTGIEKNILFYRKDDESDLEKRKILKKIEREEERKIMFLIDGKKNDAEECDKKIACLKREADNIKNDKLNFYDNLTGKIFVYPNNRIAFFLRKL